MPGYINRENQLDIMHLKFCIYKSFDLKLIIIYSDGT